MATFKHGPLTMDIRGSIGNQTFSIQKTGVSTIRNKAAVISNPSSPDQAAIRCSLAQLSKDWGDVLVQAERDAWNTYALTQPGKGNGDGGILTVIKGNNGIMSGENAYILVNQWLKSIGAASTKVAPIGRTPPTAPVITSIVWNVDRADVIWVLPTTMKVGAKVRLWIAKHQPDVHRQLVWAEDATLLTRALYFCKVAQGAAGLVKDYPGDYIIQMDTVDTDGTKSGPSNVLELNVPVTI